MKKENYNWWTDPKNKEQVERISWWNKPECKEDYMLPISVIESDGIWVASCNDETKLILGEGLYSCAQGYTKADAIEKMFQLIRIGYDYEDECRRNYQRWVPFRKGSWKHTGGKWFTIFGINVYFRYGKGMKGGWYIPLTKLNIRISNEWLQYREYKKLKQLQ